MVESLSLWLPNEAKMAIIWHQIVELWGMMLRLSSLHHSPLYKTKKTALKKNIYKTKHFVKLKNAQCINEMLPECEHTFFNISILGVFIAIYSKKHTYLFLRPMFESSTSLRRKKRWHFWNTEEILIQACAFYAKILIWKFDL